MPKIKDLIQFEKIKEVIDIDRDVKNDQDRKKLVSEYVISNAIKEHLIHFFKDLQQPTHKAIEIVGGYGSGKSHLLAFIYSVLFEPSLKQYIQNDEVRKAAEKVDRKFVIVRSELQSGKADLSDYFFDRVQNKLEQEYEINLNYQSSSCPDFKAQLQYIIETIKQKDPTCGLIVIFDEISDFIKGKTKEFINRDMQFLRILGQESQSSDFIFIGAMQEQVFSNPKYVDESESFGRIAERFNIITIQKEEIEKVLSQRILKKSNEQKLEIEQLFKPLEKIYPNLMSNIQRFIDLFPLHPYVIDVFNALPYFEKRGVLQFSIQQVEKILENDFPSFVTYHEIFNEISSKHTLKHLESIKPVLEAVLTLESKMDLLDPKERPNTEKIVKALAIQHLLGSNTSKRNGANPEELSNLLLLKPVRNMEIQDEVLLAINNLRKVTDGQFINKTKDNYFYIDLNLTIDYDEIINRKMLNPSEPSLEAQISHVFVDQLHLSSNSNGHIFNDTAPWKSHKSYREGYFIYDERSIDETLSPKDYRLIVHSPFHAQNITNAKPGDLHFLWKLTSEALELTKKIAAIQILIHDNQHRSIMEERLRKNEYHFRKALIDSAIEHGSFVFGNEKKTVKALIEREFKNFGELFAEAKISFLDSYFAKLYPKHPVFSHTISRENIKEEIDRAVKDIIKNNPNDWTQNTRSLLSSFNLTNDKGYIHYDNSEIAKIIVEKTKADKEKLHSVEEVAQQLSQKPYGIPAELTQYLFFILSNTGDIEQRGTHGKTINSSNANEFYAQGIPSAPFKYFTATKSMPINQIKRSFELLGLSPASIQRFEKQVDLNEVLQEFSDIVIKMEVNKGKINKTMEKIHQMDPFLINKEEMNQKVQYVMDLPLDEWNSIKRPVDFNKLAFDDEKLKTVQNALEHYHQLEKWNNFSAYTTIDYSKIVFQIEEKLKHSRKFYLEHAIDISSIEKAVDDIKAMGEQTYSLFAENQWSQLHGKIKKMHDDYKKIYYQAHEQIIGKKVQWELLDDITNNPYYQKLKILKNIDSIINLKPFHEIEIDLASISSSKCLELQLDMLDFNPDCPKCKFPLEQHSYQNIEHWVRQTEGVLENIYMQWQETLVKELEQYSDNINHLPSMEGQKMMNEILSSKQLPSNINDDLVKNFNENFKEIIPIEIDVRELSQEIFGDQMILSYYDFERHFKQYQQKLAQGNDIDRIRIKLKIPKEEA